MPVQVVLYLTHDYGCLEKPGIASRRFVGVLRGGQRVEEERRSANVLLQRDLMICT